MSTDNKNLADMKLPIVLVATVLMQFGAAVWWSRGQVGKHRIIDCKGHRNRQTDDHRSTGKFKTGSR